MWAAEEADARLRVMADTNTRALSGVDPSRQTRRQSAVKPLMETMMRRSASGELRWALTLFPTQAYAAEADMSLAEYEDFFYRACLCDRPDPVEAWRAQSTETKRLADWMGGREEVRLEGPGTDLTLNVSGRTFVAADGRHNMPDGEFFTGPVEDSVNGLVTFSYPAVYGGREVSGVKLRFEDGRVVDASAERNEDFLLKTLDTDEGARRLGELGIGTNYGIDRFTKEILLDEKIGGTIHLAVGMSYPETGGKNSSAVHWDMVCDLRQGGRITVDGQELQSDGKFSV
jgi:aminopeptidase